MLPTILALVAADLLLSAAVSRKPLAFARLAVIPVGKETTLPLPARVGALLMPLREGSGTYRDAPDRELRLAALPGEETVKGTQHVLRFVPESSWVLVRPRTWNSNLVRVHVSGTAEQLVLRARRLPTEIAGAIFLTVVLTQWHGALASHHSGAVMVLVATVFSMLGTRHHTSRCFTEVVDEMQRRIAIANGDPPPATTRAVRPRLNADEWMCACGKANKMRRATCGRCWAQRGDVQA